jgi:hypothetical protein
MHAAAAPVAYAETNRLCTVLLSICALDFAQAAEARGEDASRTLLGLAGLLFACAAPGKGRPSVADGLSLLLVGACLCPVLGSLTASYSTDTVTLLTRASLLLHLLSMDTREDVPQSWASPVSFNAGFAATLLMASRLRSPFLVFSFVALCAALLVFLPASLKRSPTPSTLLVVVTACAALAQLGPRTLGGFLCAVYFVGIHGPRMLQLEAQDPRSVRIVGKWDLLEVQEEEETGVVRRKR